MVEDFKKQRIPSGECLHRVRFFSTLSVAILFSLLISACPLYNPAAFVQKQAGPDDILSNATQITIQWDPPAASGAPSVASYVISYRIHGTSSWNTLATVPASGQPSYVIQRSVIGNGSFDFGVAAVYSDGILSPLHTSLDPTADPTSGWFLSW